MKTNRSSSFVLRSVIAVAAVFAPTAAFAQETQPADPAPIPPPAPPAPAPVAAPVASPVATANRTGQPEKPAVPFKSIALTANPLSLILLRIGANIEYLPATHHALVLNP